MKKDSTNNENVLKPVKTTNSKNNPINTVNPIKKETSKTTKKDTQERKTTTTKKTVAKSTPKSKTTKKTVTKSKKAKKTVKSTPKPKAKVSQPTTKLANSKKEIPPIQIIEYYDLPYRYNKTTIKLLAQTPKSLFIYWDISDKDRDFYIKKHGDDFFERTSPILIMHNTTKNYSYEIEINDYANCWYLDVNDSNSKYKIELARKNKKNNSNEFIKITSSNSMVSPNDHILFEKLTDYVLFKNTKTNETSKKSIEKITSSFKIKKIYNIYDLYKKIYADEYLDNPSSKFL